MLKLSPYADRLVGLTPQYFIPSKAIFILLRIKWFPSKMALFDNLGVNQRD
jgi:hypothetical protein